MSARFTDGWIRSRARLTYGRVNALLEGSAPDTPLEREVMPHLERMRDLASQLAAQRAARGGLDFDLPEPEVVLDALGATEGIRPSSRGPAQRLIEEFMIAANSAVALFLVERAIPALHRIHERPDPEKVREFAGVAAAFGHRFDAEPEAIEPADFRDLLSRVAGRPEEQVLARLALRTMALARYSPLPLGHFGLAAPEYLHFTSPIRRYPDLVAHRALRTARGVPETGPSGDGAEAGRHDGQSHVKPRRKTAPHAPVPAVHEDLDVLGADCSRLERTAESAERESLAWKRAEILATRLGETMEGTISSATQMGMYVELREVFAEGFLPITALAPDGYRFDPLRLTLIGETSGARFRPGQPLRVLIARVDRILQRVELALPPGEGAASRSETERIRSGRGTAHAAAAPPPGHARADRGTGEASAEREGRRGQSRLRPGDRRKGHTARRKKR